MVYNDYIILILQQSTLRRKSDQIYVNDAKQENSYEEIDLKNVKSDSVVGAEFECVVNPNSLHID